MPLSQPTILIVGSLQRKLKCFSDHRMLKRTENFPHLCHPLFGVQEASREPLPHLFLFLFNQSLPDWLQSRANKDHKCRSTTTIGWDLQQELHFFSTAPTLTRNGDWQFSDFRGSMTSTGIGACVSGNAETGVWHLSCASSAMLHAKQLLASLETLPSVPKYGCLNPDASLVSSFGESPTSGFWQ